MYTCTCTCIASVRVHAFMFEVYRCFCWTLSKTISRSITNVNHTAYMYST